MCTLEFAAGGSALKTSSGKSRKIQARFVLSRGRHQIRAGRITTTAGKAIRKLLGRLRRGHYRLLITTGRGRHRKVLLAYRFTVR